MLSADDLFGEIGKMQIAKTLLLAGLLAGGVSAGMAADGAVPLPTAVPIEASITRKRDSSTGDAIHKFAMACGLLAFAAAAQQALSSRRPSLQRVKAGKD